MAVPDSATILIENAVVIPDPLESSFLTGQSVAILGEKITAIGPKGDLRARYPQARAIDGSGQLLLPGLIDGHTHLYAALAHGMPLKGAAPRNFPEMLKKVWWRWDRALLDEENHVSALVGSICSLHNGITTIFDHQSSPRAVAGSLDCLSEGIEKIGLRACLAYEVTDRNGRDGCRLGIDENMRFIAAAYRREDTLRRGLFGLHAVFSLSDETLSRCAAEGAALRTGFHLHMAEHQPEVSQFARTHTQRIPEFLAETGILGPSTILAHTVHVNPADILIMKQAGVLSVHNPRSNMGNGNGIAPVCEMVEAGAEVGLGSDGYFDLPQEMMLTPLLQTLAKKNPGAFSDSMVLRMVYGSSAGLAGRIFGCLLGKVHPGYTADLILVPYDPPTPITEGSLSGHILAALAGGAQTALINGRVVMLGGQIAGVDEQRTFSEARQATLNIWKRLETIN